MAKAAARLLTQEEKAQAPLRVKEAGDIAQRLPGLLVAAREAASALAYGAHGRRRAGPGETFWQFRPFAPEESAQAIDWRRSAREDRLFVREREWEAAHSIWFWIDFSPSMAFLSSLSNTPKLDRAIVLGLAMADLLARGGERVGLIGLSKALAARDVIERLGQVLCVHARESEQQETPPVFPLPLRSRAVLISDFLVDPEQLEARLRVLAQNGAQGRLIMICDPVEELFPFSGHVELRDVDSAAVLRLGKAESIRADYLARLRAHRAQIEAVARRHGFTLALHRTDRPASEALLSLYAWFEASGACHLEAPNAHHARDASAYKEKDGAA